MDWKLLLVTVVKVLLFGMVALFLLLTGAYILDRMLGVSHHWIWVPLIVFVVWLEYKEAKEKAK